MLAGRLEEKQPAYNFVDGKAIVTEVNTKDYKYVLVTSYAAGGSYTAVVLKKAE